jgi:hypothetical protein
VPGASAPIGQTLNEDADMDVGFNAGGSDETRTESEAIPPPPPPRTTEELLLEASVAFPPPPLSPPFPRPKEKPPRSELQREQSRRNGALSHGPVSEQGKARSRLNALKDGLYARTLGPTPDTSYEHREFARILRRMRAEWGPRTIYVDLLLQKLAREHVQLRRIDRHREIASKADLPLERSVPPHIDQLPKLLAAIDPLLARARRLVAVADAARESVIRAAGERPQAPEPQGSDGRRKPRKSQKQKRAELAELDAAAQAAADRDVTKAAAEDPPPQLAVSVAIQAGSDMAKIARELEADYDFWNDRELPTDERTRITGDRTRYSALMQAVQLYSIVDPRRWHLNNDRYIAELLAGERDVPPGAVRAWATLLQEVGRAYEERYHKFDDEQHQRRLAEQQHVRKNFTDEQSFRAIDTIVRCGTQSTRTIERLMRLLWEAREKGL